jgi:hypothetical protein
MSVRPFDWRDFSALHRYRNQCLYLDSARLLTVGPQLFSARTLLSYFALSTGVFMYQATANNSDGEALLGQVLHANGRPFARFSYVTPATAVQSGLLTRLVEHVVKDIGEKGATHLLAEVDEEDHAFEALRKAGFATFARQRIWQFTSELGQENGQPQWEAGTRKDLISVRSLYANLVPGLVQQVEQPPLQHLRGMVLRQRNELLAYVDIHYGPRGILLQPFIHPNLEDVAGSMKNLLSFLPYRRSRPVYLCIRSYQSWLEQAIEDLGAEAGPRQAVMVRHLAIPQKNVRTYVYHALERGHPEVSAPITRRIIKNYDTTRNN